MQLHVFLHDPLSDHFIATADERKKPTSDLRFPTSSPLVQMLSNQRTSIFLSDPRALPATLQPEKTRLALLGAQLYVPLPGRQQLAGWMALGTRRSGEPYSNRDLEFLESLGDQASLAVERAQVVGDLERRVREMNVLTRVSQGINVTLAFDDILELIYAQTTQVIPSRDFYITLRDTYSEILYHVFFLENDDRLNNRENHPLPIGQGMEYELVRAHRQIVTDDYERECRNRGVLPAYQGIYAWAGVPLNTGAETIGALSLGSRDPSVVYTTEQVNLLQSIADQAAGAIVKARLLQESERRTRQLTSLNEVARSLTSTLELDPLLNQILQSAVEILNCEAGSLLLVDAQTDELVFEVAVGPVAANLVGKRLAPGTGLVGRAVDGRQPIIANDVRRTKEWLEKTDEQTGFTTNDMLVVPMQVKDQVTGVIEVINRKDSLPFTPDDQELLSAFTSQAAVALENARLYTLTDQTLAARVEELSVMQRIDRELNASLDVSRAMRITLEWAMRQSGADAGLVGIVDPTGVKLMAAQGYAAGQTPEQDNYLPDLPSVKLAIENGQPQCSHAGEPNTNHFVTLLKEAHGQTIIPIRRETTVIGLLMLESLTAETCPEDILAFLSRLSDHAAIAIANAKLYAEVQAANLAKSDFVSFVSHELKTPMTSIRGFTDLLASGVVGPVNENQANFLGTIRSNVDRMATLVGDLADVARIEANRLRLEFVPVNVQEVVDEVVRSVRAQLLEKQHTLEVAIPEGLPEMWGDRIRIIQVLTNLVSNAYKYTPAQGHIIVSAELADNQWDPEGAKKVIHLACKDNGLGMTPEDQKKIFQKFFRADDQKVREAPGTGLGLNITKTLVETQGGRIWFDSEFRKGTTFHFTVPIVEKT
jgi:signal transduction histidine kinase/putative methionine-R-sulfoxide reductase with GAF domain